MINFRYHVVSLTAVFLALAVGLVLGTAALNGPITQRLLNETESLHKSNAQLRDQIAVQEDELARRDEFVKDVAPLVLSQKLAGKKVAVVVMPGAEKSAVDGALANLRLAEATLSGTVRLTDKFSDPDSREGVRDLATRLLPPDVKEVPSDADGATASAALLGAVLLEHDPELDDADRTEVLSGYEAAELLSMDKKITEPAQGLIVVTGMPATKDEASERNAAVSAAIEQFGRAGPTVVAAPGVGGDGNPVAAVRNDPALRKGISTVDNANTSLGQLSTVLALAQRVNGGATGHYGISDGADGRIPKPTA